MIESVDSGVADYDWDTIGAAIFPTRVDVEVLAILKRPDQVTHEEVSALVARIAERRREEQFWESHRKLMSSA